MTVLEQLVTLKVKLTVKVKSATPNVKSATSNVKPTFKMNRQFNQSATRTVKRAVKLRRDTENVRKNPLWSQPDGNHLYSEKKYNCIYDW